MKDVTKDEIKDAYGDLKKELRCSIKHWMYNLRQALAGEDFNIYGRHCALCYAHHRILSGQCEGCPLGGGEYCCQEWRDVLDSLRQDRSTSKEILVPIGKMLLRLLQELEKMDR